MGETRSIEIPARRIIEMSRNYFEMNFKRVNQDGDAPAEGERPYLVVRYRDDRVFKFAEFVPSYSPTCDCVYLEEL